MNIEMVKEIQDRIEEDIKYAVSYGEFKDLDTIKKEYNNYFLVNENEILYRDYIHYHIKRDKYSFISLTIQLDDVEIEWNLGLSTETMSRLYQICKNVYEYEKRLEDEKLNNKLKYICEKIGWKGDNDYV